MCGSRYQGCKSAAHIVSAWADKNEMILVQIKVDEKSNEITAIPQLLDTGGASKGGESDEYPIVGFGFKRNDGGGDTLQEIDEMLEYLPEQVIDTIRESDVNP